MSPVRNWNCIWPDRTTRIDVNTEYPENNRSVPETSIRSRSGKTNPIIRPWPERSDGRFDEYSRIKETGPPLPTPGTRYYWFADRFLWVAGKTISFHRNS